MQFDARAAKLLKPKEHFTIDGYPGLRLVAMSNLKTSKYRYESPVDGKIRQIKLGHWPSMSLPAAIVAWEDHCYSISSDHVSRHQKILPVLVGHRPSLLGSCKPLGRCSG